MDKKFGPNDPGSLRKRANLLEEREELERQLEELKKDELRNKRKKPFPKTIGRALLVIVVLVVLTVLVMVLVVPYVHNNFFRAATPTQTLQPTATPNPTLSPGIVAALQSNGYVRDEQSDQDCTSPCIAYSNNDSGTEADILDSGTLEFQLNIEVKISRKSQIAALGSVLTSLYPKGVVSGVMNEVNTLNASTTVNGIEGNTESGTFEDFDWTVNVNDYPGPNGNYRVITVKISPLPSSGIQTPPTPTPAQIPPTGKKHK